MQPGVFGGSPYPSNPSTGGPNGGIAAGGSTAGSGGAYAGNARMAELAAQKRRFAAMPPALRAALLARMGGLVPGVGGAKASLVLDPNAGLAPTLRRGDFSTQPGHGYGTAGGGDSPEGPSSPSGPIGSGGTSSQPPNDSAAFGGVAHRPPPPLPYFNSQGPQVNLYAGLDAFHPLWLYGDVLTDYFKKRGGGFPNGGGVDPLSDLNARAMRVLGLTPPQSPGMGQGFDMTSVGMGDVLKRYLASLKAAKYGIGG